jgi:protein SCO1/2
MNPIPMPRCIPFAIVLAALTACQPSPVQREEPPLAGASIGGDFTLTDQTGRVRHWSDFRGRYAIVYFGYTYCPDVCPTDVQRTAQARRILAAKEPAKAAKLQQLFISVDPARDTTAVVREFVSAFGKDIVGLTGSEAQVSAAAAAFKVFYSKGKAEPGGAYLVDHSTVTYLFDPQGRPLATLPTDQGAEAVAAELDKWVR